MMMMNLYKVAVCVCFVVVVNSAARAHAIKSVNGSV